MSCLIVVPIFNGGELWVKAAQRLNEQRGDARVLVIDSSSDDGSAQVATDMGFELVTIAQKDFSHGGTRQLALEYLRGEHVVMYLTQDSVVRPGAIDTLLSAFDDHNVAVAYGRQLPRLSAKAIEAHARLFNYPAIAKVRGREDIPRMGLKTAFCSNSFAAYRVKDLIGAGGFPKRINFAEDMYISAKLILKNKKIAYVAEACCIHSHCYSVAQDYTRSYEIGVFHAENDWLLEAFGNAGGEGIRFVISEIGYVARHSPLLLFSVVVRTTAKYFGYKKGLRSRRANGFHKKDEIF